jgi:pyruvate/2-oxoglutarate dehydrogenase complex dihydrolipoamide acyltransferase (E2) component
MDAHREHGDSSPATGPSSALASDDLGAPQGTTEPVADAAPADSPMPAHGSQGAQAAGDETPPEADAASEPDADAASEPDPADTLSPAVRRLVRQYDLDITGVYGTGPAGKIRVGDIIGMLDGRPELRARTSEAANRPAPTVRVADAAGQHASGTPSDDLDDRRDATQTLAQSSDATEAAHPVPTTTVFECDLSRVLSHRKRERRGDVELLLASYFVAACLEALSAVPEIAAGVPDSTQPQTAELTPRLGVSLATTDGSVRRALVGTAATALDERLRAVDAQLRTSVDEDLRSARILIHYFAASGSLLATPTAIGAGHVASVGIGRVRREIVVRTIDGQEAPRIAALCYLTLTFRPDRIALERANRFVGELVRVLEQWPIEPATAV